jgi:protein involved in polysaccharide export with SLBB domain
MRKISPYSAACFISLIFLFLISGLSASAQQVKMSPVAPSSLQPANEQSPLKTQPASQPTLIQQKLEQDQQQDLEQGKQQQETLKPATRPKLSAETLSKFEQFIAGEAVLTVSTNIKQFGYDLFKEVSPAFTPSANVPVGPDYVVGPGDEIKITVWGKIEGTGNVTIDRDGNISLPKAGVLGVTGLTFNQLRELLQKEFSKYYTGFEMSVSLGALRTMRVYVVGNAQNPGAYTVSALSTIVNALLESGGPSKTGTMRDIQLKRNGQTIGHFDLYDLLLKGDKSKDERLLPEDVIFIPSVGPLIGIAGNVKNPAIYELSGETRLLDLIQMAGGLMSVAFKGRVQVERITDHQFRTIFEGNLFDLESSAEKNFVLQDGDLVKVFAIIDTKNTITLRGSGQRG